MPRDVGDDTTTMLTDPDPTTTGESGPSTLGTTTSTVTTDPVTSSSEASTTIDPTDTATTTTTTGDTDATSTSTTDDPPCNHDMVCDGDESIATCLADCAGCEPDETCDASTESAYACPSDCAATACDHNALVDPLTEQCDDGNQENADACTNACMLNTCGDGFLFPAAKGGSEECDDGNLDDQDGCSAKCLREHRIVFVSSQEYKGNLTPGIDDLTGLDLGDAHCQILASEADHPGTFRAWLSDGAKSPGNRFGISGSFAGLYELPTGVVVAEGWQDLTDGTLAHPIDTNEKGMLLEPAIVWTNTAVSGLGTGPKHCQGWTSNSFPDVAPAGSTQAVNGEWTAAYAEFPCSAGARLYCIQIE